MTPEVSSRAGMYMLSQHSHVPKCPTTTSELHTWPTRPTLLLCKPTSTLPPSSDYDCAACLHAPRAVSLVHEACATLKTFLRV